MRVEEVDEHLHVQGSYSASPQHVEFVICSVWGEENEEGVFDPHAKSWDGCLCDHHVEVGDLEELVIAWEGKVHFGPLEVRGYVVEYSEGVVEHDCYCARPVVRLAWPQVC